MYDPPLAGVRVIDLSAGPMAVSSGTTNGVHLELQRDLELADLRLLSEMQAYGSTAGAMVQVASMAVQAGMADVVACVWADAPLRQGRSAGAAPLPRQVRSGPRASSSSTPAAANCPATTCGA